MSPLETAKLALRSLKLQKFRALLTALGIVIGVAAVIAMLSISEGARIETLQQIRLMGINNVRVRSVKPAIADRKQEEQQNQNWVFRYGVLQSDLAHWYSLSDRIRRIVPIREVRKDVWARDAKTDIRVVGTTPDLSDVLDYRPATGRFLSVTDQRERRRVCVLGAEAKRKLFRYKSWVGQDIKVADVYFRVVGVMEEKEIKSSGSIQLANLNNQIYVPYSAVMDRFGALSIDRGQGTTESISIDLDEAIVQVKDEESILPV